MNLKFLFQELDWILFQTTKDTQERHYRKKIGDDKSFPVEFGRLSRVWASWSRACLSWWWWWRTWRWWWPWWCWWCRGCGQAGQGPACQILQMGGVGEMLSVRYCQILQIIAPTSNSPAVSGQQGRMFASDPVRFYNQSPPVLNKDVWGHGFRGSSDLLQVMDF